MHAFLLAISILSVFFLFMVLYISFMTILYCEKRSPRNPALPTMGISIVIPFYNEAPHLAGLLNSLVTQEYPGPYEIILVNDGSSDDFLRLINPFLQSSNRSVKLIRSDFDNRKKLTSKQQALDIGVANAQYPYIAFTDADMTFKSDWLFSLAKMAPLGYDLVFGHTTIQKTRGNLLDSLQAFQLEFLFAVAYAFHASKIPGSCMGNNLLISKKAYAAVGGQSGIGYSIVEDRALFSAIKRYGFKSAPVYPFVSRAETYPCKDLGGFFHQMLRWARGGFFNGHDLLPIAVLLCVHYGVLIHSLFNGMHGRFSCIAIANFGILLFFVYCAFRKIGSQERSFLFPVYYAILLLETISCLFSFIASPSISWKNRKL
jgi:cellulose synthase/poly-beta-1,6-N-acetylglucosamine synthase-like glycosyltransferase